MQDATAIKIAAITLIGAIEICALLQGMNGVYLTLAVGVIAGIAGYTLKSVASK